MSLSIHFTPKVRKGIVHGIVFIFFLFIVLFQFPLTPQDTVAGGKVYHWQDLGVILLLITGFYLHSLVLLPVLLQQKNIKKYVFFVILCVIIFGITLVWFESVRSSLITRYVDGTRPIPMDVFVNTLSKWKVILALIVMFIPFSGITFIYYLLYVTKKHRKELFS